MSRVPFSLLWESISRGVREIAIEAHLFPNYEDDPVFKYQKQKSAYTISATIERKQDIHALTRTIGVKLNGC